MKVLSLTCFHTSRHLRSPEQEEGVRGEQSQIWMRRINMAPLGSRVTRLFLLTRCRTSRPGWIRSGPVQNRCLSSSPTTGTWSSQLSGLSHRDLYRLSVTDPDQFWGSAADRLCWMKPFDQVRDCDLHTGKISWFVGGKLNVSGERLLTVRLINN